MDLFHLSRRAFALSSLIVLLSLSGWSLLRAQSQPPAQNQPARQSASQAQRPSNPQTPQPSNPKAPQPSSPSAASQPAAHIDRNAIVNHLNLAISWYRDSNSKVQAPGQPSDVIYRDNAQNFAAEALRLAFQSAKEEAEIISTADKGDTGDEDNQPDASGQPNYTRFQIRLAAQMADLQSQIDAQNKAIASASASTRQQAVAKRDALQGQMDLYKSMQDAVQKMATFAETTEASTSGLAGTINTLARSAPKCSPILKTPGTPNLPQRQRLPPRKHKIPTPPAWSARWSPCMTSSPTCTRSMAWSRKPDACAPPPTPFEAPARQSRSYHSRRKHRPESESQRVIHAESARVRFAAIRGGRPETLSRSYRAVPLLLRRHGSSRPGSGRARSEPGKFPGMATFHRSRIVCDPAIAAHARAGHCHRAGRGISALRNLAQVDFSVISAISAAAGSFSCCASSSSDFSLASSSFSAS